MVKLKLNSWLKNKIRKQAVNATKRELILRGTEIHTLQPNELAYLVNQAENDIIQQWQQRGLLAIAAMFGITVF